VRLVEDPVADREQLAELRADQRGAIVAGPAQQRPVDRLDCAVGTDGQETAGSVVVELPGTFRHGGHDGAQ
jgi:hypothetical protein